MIWRLYWIFLGLLWAALAGSQTALYLSGEYPHAIGHAVFAGLFSMGAFLQGASQGIRDAILATKK